MSRLICQQCRAPVKPGEYIFLERRLCIRRCAPPKPARHVGTPSSWRFGDHAAHQAATRMCREVVSSAQRGEEVVSLGRYFIEAFRMLHDEVRSRGGSGILGDVYRDLDYARRAAYRWTGRLLQAFGADVPPSTLATIWLEQFPEPGATRAPFP